MVQLKRYDGLKKCKTRCTPCLFVEIETAFAINKRYKMVSAVEHIGPSIYKGHYVAHVLYDNEWILCDDDKLLRASDSPFDTPEQPYLMLFKLDDFDD